MSAGERLATLAGPTAVLGIQPQHTAGQHTPQTVYNLEVQGQHVFRVTSNGLLVHNSYGPRGILSGNVTVKQSKWDYFFGRVTSGKKNTDRSLQNLKDLKTLGFNDTEAGRTGLTKLFEIGRHGPEKARQVTKFGITITRRVPAGSRGAIDVKYFYPGGDFSAIPKIPSIIPKIF